MSYDLEIGAKVVGASEIVTIGYPECDHPTYNYGLMIRECTGWDFKQSEWYCCADVIDKIEHGIAELVMNGEKYKKYEPTNGWGNMDGAIRVLRSLQNCICEWEEKIPLTSLYVRW